jgi:hypothetical protein
MRSQYRCSSSDKREEVEDVLHAHGYDDVFPAGANDRRTLVIVHPDAFVGRVAYLVYRVDPTAQRIR